jgi:catechol 2,3-dioxygenase-like lactoylglutathione lyase family enzyme
MLDHIGFSVSDFERAKAFYSAALAPLGIALLFEVTAEQTGAEAHAGFGTPGRAFFWIGTGATASRGLHAAFAAPDRAAVDAFHAAALAAGGTDNGAPGIRAHYAPDYYGAFIHDADGNNIEAVCRQPASGSGR